MLLVLVYLSLISNVSWTIVFSAIMCIVVMRTLFPDIPKAFYIVLSLVVFVTFASISIISFLGLYSYRRIRTSMSSILFTQFQGIFRTTYCPRNGYGGCFWNQYDISTLVNDFLGIPLPIKYVDQANRTNVFSTCTLV